MQINKKAYKAGGGKAVAEN